MSLYYPPCDPSCDILFLPMQHFFDKAIMLLWGMDITWDSKVMDDNHLAQELYRLVRVTESRIHTCAN